MDEKTFRESFREEWKKLSTMTWGQRLGYIWDYYKPVMVAILVVLALISIGVSVYHNLQINRLLQVYITDCNSANVDTQEMTDAFAAYLGGIGTHDEITIDATLSVDTQDASNYSMASQMKLIAVSAAGEADVVLLNESGYQKYQEAGGMKNLEEVLNEEQLKKWSELLVRGKKPETGEDGVYALQVQGSQVLKKYNAYEDENVYCCIFSNSEHVDMDIKFIEYLLDNQNVEG